MESKKFIKMSDLVNQRFTIVKVNKYSFKKWDNDNKKMLVSETWQQGYQKIYQVETDYGYVDMTSAKIGEMLESVSKFGESSIVGKVFNLKSNGKTGIDIRYYINPERTDTTGSGYQKAVEMANQIKERVNNPENDTSKWQAPLDDEDMFKPLSEEEMNEIPF